MAFDLNSIVAVISIASTAVAIVGWIRECTRQQTSRDGHLSRMDRELGEVVQRCDRIEDGVEQIKTLIIRDRIHA